MQTTIGQRVKFLLDHFNLSARKFSREIGVAENNTQNYLPPSSREPGAKYLELILLRFESINPDWLITGKGEPFLASFTATDEPLVNYTKNNFGKNSNVGINSGAGTQHIGAADAAKALEIAQAELALAKQEIESLRNQLARADALVVAKDETITLLRATYNRPN